MLRRETTNHTVAWFGDQNRLGEPYSSSPLLETIGLLKNALIYP
jgi:hypothetical protein